MFSGSRWLASALPGATFLFTSFAYRHTGCHTYYRMNITNMVYLEDERLAREARAEAARTGEESEFHCPDCGALVTVHPTDDESVGVCRCLCGSYWEVEIAS